MTLDTNYRTWIYNFRLYIKKFQSIIIPWSLYILVVLFWLNVRNCYLQVLTNFTGWNYDLKTLDTNYRTWIYTFTTSYSDPTCRYTTLQHNSVQDKAAMAFHMKVLKVKVDFKKPSSGSIPKSLKICTIYITFLSLKQ